MDKNMINIDDLVRQRLNGGEEQERAGAWLHMRDLLDDKMPVRAAGGYNWRRMLTAATGLLLFASLTVGGYKMYTNYRPDQEVLLAGNVSMSEPKSHAVINDNSGDNKIAVKTTASESELSGNTDKGNPNMTAGEVDSRSTVMPSKELTGTASLSNDRATTRSQKSNNNSQLNTQKSTSPTGRNQQDLPQAATNLPTAATSLPASAAANNTSLQSGSLKPGTNTTSNNLTNNSTATATASTAITNKNSAQSAPIVQHPSNNPVLSKNNQISASQTGLVKQDNTVVKNTIVKDSIPKIAVTETVKVDPIRRTVTATHDTTSIGKMAIDRTVASPMLASAQGKVAAKAEIVPQSATAGAETKAIAAAGTKSRSDKSGFLENLRLKERMEELNFRIGQVKFHTGITGGVNNYMYPTNSMLGIHLGLRETAVLDEKWSLFIEPKYMQRFNKDHVIRDNYWRVGDLMSGNQYKANEIEHFFKFSALHTIEMPVAVRYALFRQLHIFAGANLAYNFKINAEEVTRISEEQIYTGNGTGLQTKPTINIDHFGSRMSAGYLLGLGYQLSPNFDVDIRMTRNFWDNAAGSGARNISDQLLYRPSFQFSIGYRFIRKNKVPPAK